MARRLICSVSFLCPATTATCAPKAIKALAAEAWYALTWENAMIHSLIFRSLARREALSLAIRSDSSIGNDSRESDSSTLIPASIKSAMILKVVGFAKIKCLVSKAIPRNSAFASSLEGLSCRVL